MKENKNKNKNNKKLIPIIVISILIIIGIVVLIIINPFKNNNNNDNQSYVIGLDESQGDFKEQEQVYQRSIILPGWKELHISANTTDITSGIDFYNPKGNLWYECQKCYHELDDNYKCTNENCNEQYTSQTAKTNCFYLTFALYLSDNNECLYQSKLVEPDKHIQHISLERSLDKGEYNAYVFIQPYMSDMKTPLNNGRVDIKLIVE